jgi:hypothetical protein
MTPDADPASAVSLREIYRLRGKIVSDVNGVEGFVDMAVSTYFVDAEHTHHFRTWVLARLPLSEKLSVLEQVVDELGIKERVHQTLTRLRAANDIRNEQAHSNVSHNPAVREVSSETIETFLQWHSRRYSRRGLQATRIEVEELEKSATLVDALTIEVVRIHAALVARRNGGDPLAALDEFDTANPEVAEAILSDPSARAVRAKLPKGVRSE